jgi:octaprenyl-diphosphate synthase
MDIHWHRDPDSLPGLEEYYTMCGLKTGCLARLAAVLGVLAALPGSEERSNGAREEAGRAAEKLGVGFQILDDVKDLRGGLPGKRRGGDVVEGKKSLPVLLYLHGEAEAGPRRALVRRCFDRARRNGPAAPEVEELIAALEGEGALEQAWERGRALIQEAAETLAAPSLAGIPLEEPGRRLMAGFVDLIS